MSDFFWAQRLGQVSISIVLMVKLKSALRRVGATKEKPVLLHQWSISMVIMVDLKSALHRVGTTTEKVDLLYRWRFWKAHANTMCWEMEKKRVQSTVDQGNEKSSGD